MPTEQITPGDLFISAMPHSVFAPRYVETDRKKVEDFWRTGIGMFGAVPVSPGSVVLVTKVIISPRTVRLSRNIGTKPSVSIVLLHNEELIVFEQDHQFFRWFRKLDKESAELGKAARQEFENVF